MWPDPITIPAPLYVVVPGVNGWLDAYQIDRRGLISLTSHRSMAKALEMYPGAKVLPMLWDARIIDPGRPIDLPGRAGRPVLGPAVIRPRPVGWSAGRCDGAKAGWPDP